jgi:guanyl-specific ribonuclease Sa
MNRPSVTRRASRMVAVMLLLASACGGDAEVEPTLPATQPTQEVSPSPTAAPSFQLEGRVIQASGSVKANQATPSPAATATASPGTTGGPGTHPASGIEQGAPGSLAVRLSSYSGENSDCVFAEGDTVVVFYSRASTFEPAGLIGNAGFPNNLRNANVVVAGRILDEELCLLAADSVATAAGVEASPTAGRRGDTTRTSPPPRRATTTTRRVAPATTTTTAPTPTTTEPEEDDDNPGDIDIPEITFPSPP